MASSTKDLKEDLIEDLEDITEIFFHKCCSSAADLMEVFFYEKP